MIKIERLNGEVTVQLDPNPSHGLLYLDRSAAGEQPAWWLARVWPLTIAFSEAEGT